LRSPGCGLAQSAVLAVLNGPARHEFRPAGPCLGRRPSTRHAMPRLRRHGVPCQADTLRAVPVSCRAGLARWPSIRTGSYKLISADSKATDSYCLFYRRDSMQQPQIQNIYMDGKRLNWVTASSFFFLHFLYFLRDLR
jgi:hypothetical protein